MQSFLKKQIKLTDNRGFTLLELLVVVSIIAFLATISLVALGIAQARARDSKRQVDAFSVIKAAELHYSDNGFAPIGYKKLGMINADDFREVSKPSLFEYLIPVAHADRLNVEQVTGDGGGGGGCPTYKACVGILCQSVTSCNGNPGGGLCSVDADCEPATAREDLYIRDDCLTNDTESCWLSGLDPYLSLIPVDPGKHEISDYDYYYVSSHPDIVKNHGFCFFWSYEREENNIANSPYSDIDESSAPTFDGDTEWSVLCMR